MENDGPPISKEEIAHTIHQTKGGKASGKDQKTSEMWIALADFGEENF